MTKNGQKVHRSFRSLFSSFCYPFRIEDIFSESFGQCGLKDKSKKSLKIGTFIVIEFDFICRLADRTRNERFGSEFFIDASHELSLFAWNNGKGHSLTMAPYFCLDRDSTNTPTTIITTTTTTTQSPHNDNGNGCAIYSRNHDSISRNHIHTARDSTQSSFVSEYVGFRNKSVLVQMFLTAIAGILVSYKMNLAIHIPYAASNMVNKLCCGASKLNTTQ